MRCTATLVLALAMLAPRSRPAFAAHASTDTLSVVTLNLWNDQGDWPRRLEVILSGLRAARADVICLQEVLQHPGLPNQAETIADSLGWHWHFVSVDSVTRAKRYGNAILTPHRVLSAGGRNLLPLDDYRVVAHLRLDVRGRLLDVYDTHLHHTDAGGEIRARQIADLIAFIDSTRAAGPLVLAGDFNAGLEAPEMASLAAAYRDAYRTQHLDASAVEAETLNPAFGYPPRTIDHVFVPAGSVALVPVEARVLFREAGPDSVWASDHFGVLARFAMAGKSRSDGARHGGGSGR